MQSSRGSWAPAIYDHCMVPSWYHRKWGHAGLSTYPRVIEGKMKLHLG